MAQPRDSDTRAKVEVLVPFGVIEVLPVAMGEHEVGLAAHAVGIVRAHEVLLLVLFGDKRFLDGRECAARRRRRRRRGERGGASDAGEPHTTATKHERGKWGMERPSLSVGTWKRTAHWKRNVRWRKRGTSSVTNCAIHTFVDHTNNVTSAKDFHKQDLVAT
jgi:hypothetical protein